MWDKKLWRKNVISLSFIHTNFSLPETFWITKIFPNKVSASVGPQNFDGRTWYPPSIQEMFSLPEALWKIELNQKKVFGNVRQKTSTEKPDIPLSHPHKFFAARISLKPRRVPKIFSVIWDQWFDRNLRYTPALTFYFFKYQKISQTKKRSQ